MNRSSKFQKRLIILALALTLGLGSLFTVKAAFPQSFWRMTQLAERLTFLYGGADNPTEYFGVESDGRVGIGTIPQNESALLELKSEDKGLIVPRLNSVFDIDSTLFEEGMIVYEIARECFRVYQNGDWSQCLGTSGSIRVLDAEPTDGMLGDIYYNTTNNTLYIHDGNTFVAVTANFQALVPYNHSCERLAPAEPNLQVQCPNNKHITSLFYEPATFSHTIDIHTTPEVSEVECCATTHYPFFWHTTDWSACAGGSQSREVSCRDINNNIVSDDLCIAGHRPPTTQSCQVPIVPARWVSGDYGVCSRAGVQTRTVSCVSESGEPMPGQCDPAIKPPTARGCEVPFDCREALIEVNHPLYDYIYGPKSGVTLGFDRVTFQNSGAITGFIRDIQPVGLTGAGVVGMKNGISGANMSSSATARAVCEKAGFLNVLSGTDADAWHSPGDNTLYYWNGTAFATTNAKHPKNNVRKDRKINTLTCVDPFGISVDSRCPGAPTPPTNPECSLRRIYDSAAGVGTKGQVLFYDVPCDGAIQSFFHDDNARINLVKVEGGDKQVLLACDNELSDIGDEAGVSFCHTRIPQHGGVLCNRDNSLNVRLRNDGRAKGCPGAFEDHQVQVNAGDRLEIHNSSFADGHGWVNFIPR